MQYSIWLIPSAPAFELLQNTIYTLAEKYEGPVFEPHITLLSNVEKELSEITTSLEMLAKNVYQFELRLGEISFSTTYFQSVLVRVQSTAALMQLYLDTKTSLHIEQSAFMPHMSLLYGSHNMGARERIASTTQLPPTAFFVKEFVITPATPNPREWNHLATIPFAH